MNYWSDYSIAALLLTLGTSLFFLILYLDRKAKYWKNNGISSPVVGFGTLLVQLYYYFTKPLHENQVEMHKKYGRIHGEVFCMKLQLSIAEPELIKKILLKDFDKFHNRMELKTGIPTFDKMLGALADDDWKRIRCIVSPTFTSSRMRKMAHLVRECAENFIKHIEKLTEKNDTFDCKKYFNHFTLDIIASTAFGTKLDSLDDPDNEFFSNVKKVTSSESKLFLFLMFAFPSAFRLLNIDIFSGKIFRYFNDFALHVIKQRDQNKYRGNDFLQLMIDAQRGVLEKTQEDIQEEAENNIEMLPKHKTMSMDEMLAQCSLFIFAGNETTATTLALFVYYITLNKECQEKLIKEVDETWEKHESMSFDTLTEMTYLDAALNELLRIMPISLILMRKCTEEYELTEVGFKIPKGMDVVIPLYAMHHDPEFYPNPELFDPERFMPENRSSIPQYAYLPFGDGPRNCIGMRFAIMVMKMCIVYIFRNFRIHATEETRKKLVLNEGQGLLQPKHVIVKFEKRKL